MFNTPLSFADDPYWCSVKIDGQKRFTREVTGENPWSDHVSLMVYNLHADKVNINQYLSDGVLFSLTGNYSTDL